MNTPPRPVLTDHGQQAIDALSAPGPVSAAEVLALAVLLGELQAPVVNDEEGA
jgi:hypothetical protein